MFAYRLIFLGFLAFFAHSAAALDGKDILPVDEAFKLSVKGLANDRLQLNWAVAKGYHLYRDKIKIESRTDTVKVAEITLPEGEIDHDPVFGDMVVYRQALEAAVLLLNPQHLPQFKLFVKYQGCADLGVCYPPQKVELDVNLPATAAIGGSPALQQMAQGLKGLTGGLFSSDLLPPEQAFQFFATVKDEHTLHVSWLAAEGYYLYKNKLALSLVGEPSVGLDHYVLPKGEMHHDAEFGDVEIYRQEVSADVHLSRQSSQAETVILTAKYQGCADRGVCYPPLESSLSLSLPAVSAASISVSAMPAPAAAGAAPEQDQIVNSLKQDSLLPTLVSFFGFGLLLAFTPCVFPMIPILSGIIVGQGDTITTRKAFLLSLSYVLASALMYTLFGILAALFGENLQAAFQEPWVIAVFSALFVGLALSMFGFYNLEMPQALQAKFINSSDRHRDGSYLGAAIMGALSSLIVGPCVAAPLAAALIYIGQTGDVVLGGSALFVMGLGMGAPLLLLGASAGKLLPKAGTWLDTTKSVFGVIMLAVAIWMLSRILPVAATMLLTAMLLMTSAVFLGAMEYLPVSASGWRKLWKGLGVAMLAYGLLMLIGLSAGSDNLLQPLRGLLSAGGPVAEQHGVAFQRVKSVAELESRLKQAADSRQPVMLDFYADWCVSCKEMESYTFTDAAVRQGLAGFVLLQADVTENSADDKALLQRFGLVGPPGIIFFAADGREQTASRVIGFQDAAAFVRTLQGL
ncbi:MAG: protein-disulfide reductase DsbD [Methylococcales bacterium]|nr:protein-disulfide reductase DsbD [Methylococcales bacterium]